MGNILLLGGAMAEFLYGRPQAGFGLPPDEKPGREEIRQTGGADLLCSRRDIVGDPQKGQPSGLIVINGIGRGGVLITRLANRAKHSQPFP